MTIRALHGLLPALLLLLVVLAKCDDAPLQALAATTMNVNPLCEFIAATTIEEFHSGWACTEYGQPVTNPCENPNQWVGIVCSEPTAAGNITSMNVASFMLAGTLPSAIGQMTDLTLLVANSNSLNGILPSSLGLLTRLQELLLGQNSFSGTIPSTFGSLVALTGLYLLQNCLSGSLPSSLGQLARLKQLEIYVNVLSGPIPAEFGSLSSLGWFQGAYNSFSGPFPSALLQLTQLISLQLGSNWFTGTLPSGLSALSKLRDLSFDSTSIHGTLPPALGQMSSLVTLELSDDNLSGAIPSTFGSLFLLSFLDLSQNLLTGALPPELGSLSNLMSLSLSSNGFIGTLPTKLTGMSSLTVMYLNSNSLTGMVPAALGCMTSLVEVFINNNSLEGIIPSLLSQLVNLNQLHLNGNYLTGSLPSELGTLSELAYLYLFDNMLTGHVPESFASLDKLNILYLSQNLLSGTVPTSLGLAETLAILYLNDNHFSGDVPQALGDAPALAYLYLGNNTLSGTLPTQITNGLSLLYVQNNYLTGFLPSNGTELKYVNVTNNRLVGDFGFLSSSLNPLLYIADLSYNGFVGTIPSDLSTTLGSLSLSGNLGLTGTIPTSLANLSLNYADFSNSQIDGSIPSELCDMTSLNLDVSSTGISCFSGCLTSAAVLVTGASPDCHDGSIMHKFLVICAVFLLCVLVFSLAYKSGVAVLCTPEREQQEPIGGEADNGNDNGNGNGNGNISSQEDKSRRRWHNLCPSLTAFSKIFAGSHLRSASRTRSHSRGSKDPDDHAHSEWRRLVNRYIFDNSVVAIAFVKLLLALAISFSLNDWWSYGPNSSEARNSEVLESCSNSQVGRCFSFCDASITVDVQVEDDDIRFDDLVAPPNVIITGHQSTTGYCVAELTGRCAYDYWMVFKFVPVMLCVLLFALQCFSYWYYKEFTPQQKQYDIVLRELYPSVMEDEPEPEPECESESIQGTDADIDTEAASAPQTAGTAAEQEHPATVCDKKQMRWGTQRWVLLRRLRKPYFYNVFALIETITVVYVWGELWLPSTYCGAARPLSLYYYPILMSLLDLTKFNIYVAGKLFWTRRDAEALFALLNMEMFLTNLWVTVLLSVLFVGDLMSLGMHCMVTASSPLRSAASGDGSCHGSGEAQQSNKYENNATDGSGRGTNSGNGFKHSSVADESDTDNPLRRSSLHWTPGTAADGVDCTAGDNANWQLSNSEKEKEERELAKVRVSSHDFL